MELFPNELADEPPMHREERIDVYQRMAAAELRARYPNLSRLESLEKILSGLEKRETVKATARKMISAFVEFAESEGDAETKAAAYKIAEKFIDFVSNFK